MKRITIIGLTFLLHSLASAQSWQWLGPDSSSVYFVYANDDTVYIKSSNNYKSTDGGATWNILDDTDPEFGGGFFLLNVDPQNSNRIFVSDWNGKLWRSTDGGNNWEPLIAGTEPWPEESYIRKLYVSPHNKNIIFIILRDGSWESLVRTTDGGENWEDVSAFASSSHGSQITFAFDPIDSATIYVAGDDQMAHTAFYPSYDLGDSWYFFPNSISTEKIFVDWNDNNRIYLFARPMVSEDGGMTWTDKVEGLPFGVNWSSFLLDPTDSNILYMLTGAGMYRTINRAEQWNLIPGSENLNLSFAHGSYYDNIFVDSSTYKLYVGTKQGLYKYDLLTSVEEENENIPGEFILHQNYPNPFNPTTTIKYSLTPSLSQRERVFNLSSESRFYREETEGRVRVLLKVYDILGKEVATLVNKEQTPGTYEVNFNGEGLPSGIYIYRLAIHSDKLTVGTSSFTRKMLLLK